MKRITHIVPRFWPEIDGVGDFARQLARELECGFEVENHFLVGCGGEGSVPNVSLLEARDAPILAEELERIGGDWVLLHYSGYGFHERGVPRWLIDGLKRHVSAGNRLAVFFHEVWASGPPWRSEFYLQHSQRELVAQFSSIAKASFTSTPRMQRLLRGVGAEAAVLPIPSPLPPVAEARAVAAGSTVKLVIFGQEHNRARTLRVHGTLITHLMRENRLASLALIGKGAQITEGPSEAQEKTVALPGADAETALGYLAEADAMLSFYPADLLTKSSAVMAAFACGCPVILPSAKSKEPFDPVPPFLACDGSAKEISALLEVQARGEWMKIGQRALAWYRSHASWERVAPEIARALALDRKSQFVEAA